MADVGTACTECFVARCGWVGRSSHCAHADPGTSAPMAAKAKLICPLEHDSGVLWGGSPTLEYRLFQLLADNPLGLHLGQIQRALSRQHAPGDAAESVLVESKYFFQTGEELGPIMQRLAFTAMRCLCGADAG